MSIALPIPYDEELLFSVVARYLESANVSAPTFVIDTLFGRLARPKKELICSLSDFSRETYVAWGLRPLDIARRHTVVPYYASYTTAARRAAAYAGICGQAGPSPAVTLRVNHTNVARVDHLRWCKRCAMCDVLEGRRPYWRRAHQLPGVLTCPEHGTPLCVAEAESSSGPMKWRPVLDEDTINWRDNVHVRAAQMTSIEALAARDSDRFSPALETDWLAVAQQRGFVKSSGYIDTGALMTKMNDLYGGAYLEATSLDMVAKQSAPWVVRLLKCSHTLFHPLQYILMAHLLRQCEGPNRRAEVAPRLRTNQPIVCPNSYAAHEPKHAVEEVRVTETADRQQVGHARCICGLRFTFSRCEADGETPCDVQITKYGHDWANAVRAMHGQGHSYPAIERSMGLPPRAALRMSKRLGDQKRSKPTPAQLLQCRREWRQTLRKVAPGGHLLAAQRNKLLYNRLREFDRDWLTRSAQRRGQPRRKASEMEWKRRDREWRTRLETAAAKLRGLDSPAVRVSKAAMAAEAGVWVLGASVRNKLPLCHAALRDLAESAEQFQIRRLEVARMRLSACSQEVTRWKLLKLACISRVLNPIVEAALTELEIKNVTRHSPARAPVD